MGLWFSSWRLPCPISASRHDCESTMCCTLRPSAIRSLSSSRMRIIGHTLSGVVLSAVFRRAAAARGRLRFMGFVGVCRPLMPSIPSSTRNLFQPASIAFHHLSFVSQVLQAFCQSVPCVSQRRSSRCLGGGPFRA